MKHIWAVSHPDEGIGMTVIAENPDEARIGILRTRQTQQARELIERGPKCDS